MNYYLRQSSQRMKQPWRKIATAMLLLATLAFGGYFWFAEGRKESGKTAADHKSASEPIRYPVIGVIAPLSGPMKREGDSFREGTELAWKELQSQGLQGEMLFRDSGKEDAEILRAVQQLLSDPRVSILMVHMPMTVLSRILPDCQKQKVLLVAPANSHEELARSSWGLPFIASDRHEGVQAADIARDLADGAKLALLYEPGPYGELLLQGFQEGAAKYSSEYQTTPCRVDDPTLRTTLSEKLSPETTLVFLAGSPAWGIAVSEVLSELSFQGRLLLPQSYGKMALEDLADNFAERLYVMRPLLTEATGNTALENLHKTFVRTYWKKPDELAILAYDAMNWVGNALKTATATREELRERLRSGTHAEAPYGGAGGEVFFDDRGILQRRMQLTLYRNGKFYPASTSK